MFLGCNLTLIPEALAWYPWFKALILLSTLFGGDFNPWLCVVTICSMMPCNEEWNSHKTLFRTVQYSMRFMSGRDQESEHWNNDVVVVVVVYYLHSFTYLTGRVVLSQKKFLLSGKSLRREQIAISLSAISDITVCH